MTFGKRLLWGFLLYWVSIQIYALDSDLKQTMRLYADKAVFNKKMGIGQYDGHVKIIQGNTIILADTATSYNDAIGHLEKIIALGRPAIYRTLVYPKRPELIAVANIINYYPQRLWVKFITHAKITQGQNIFTAHQINYDITRQTITSFPAVKKRVHIVIQPNLFAR